MLALRQNQRVFGCCSGGIAVMSAIVLPLLFGFAAFGIEVSGWYLTQRKMQGSADAAVISAAAAYIAGDDYVSVGKTYASQNGWTDGSNSVTVAITGFLTASPPHIDADISQAQTSMFSKFLPGVTAMPTLKAHASVTLVTNTANGTGCLIGLSHTASGGAIQISGQGNLNAPSCIVASNTTTPTQPPNNCVNVSPPCITLSGGNAGMNIAELDVATKAPFACPSGPTCTVGKTQTFYPLWTHDPYATLVMPTIPSCPGINPATSGGGGVTVYSPGVYCQSGGISVTNNQYAVFKAGTYWLGGSNNATASSLAISGGSYVNLPLSTVASATVSAQGTGYKNNDPLTVSGGTFTAPLNAATFKVASQSGGKITAITFTNAGSYTVVPTNPVSVTGGSGTGAKLTLTLNPAPGAVTFISTGPSASKVGTLSINGGTVSLTAPSSGATNGLIFWQNKIGTSGATLAGNPTSVTLNGALYFPNTQVAISGSYSFQPTNCTAIVANVISFTGQGTITKGCLPIGGGGGGGAIGWHISQ